MELISLIRSFRRSQNKGTLLLFFLLLPLGYLLPSQEVTSFYEKLIVELGEKRQASYKLFMESLERLKNYQEMKREAPQEKRESKWEMLPQRLEEWRKGNSSTLFALRLKALVAEVEKKSKETKEFQDRLSSAFQLLLSQWETSPSPPTLSPEEMPLSIPQFEPLKPWWGSPTLIGSVVPIERRTAIEGKFQGLDQVMEEEKMVTAKELERYKTILEEVRRKCPLP